MLVGEFLERIQHGETVKKISDEVGLHRKTLQRRLRNLGYVWCEVQVKWIWEDEMERAPLDVSLVERGKNRTLAPLDADRSQKKSPNPTQNSTKSHEFTSSEVKELRSMLHTWNQEEGFRSNVMGVSEEDLVLEIQKIKNSENKKVRKTIVIDEEIGDQFDRFAETTRLNKSDLLHLAIHEMMDKYDVT